MTEIERAMGIAREVAESVRNAAAAFRKYWEARKEAEFEWDGARYRRRKEGK